MYAASSSCALDTTPPAPGLQWPAGDYLFLLWLWLGIVVLGTIFTLAIPGKRYVWRTLLLSLVSILLVGGGSLLKYGVAQPWLDAIHRWSDTATTTSPACFHVLQPFVTQSSHAASNMSFAGAIMAALGVLAVVAIPNSRPVHPLAALREYLARRNSRRTEPQA